MKSRFGNAQSLGGVDRFLYLNIRRNTTTTVEHSPCSGFYCWACVRMWSWRSQCQRRIKVAWPSGAKWLSRGLNSIVPRVVIVKRAARIVSLQGTPIRCVVTSGSQGKARIEGELKDSVAQSLRK